MGAQRGAAETLRSAAASAAFPGASAEAAGPQQPLPLAGLLGGLNPRPEGGMRSNTLRSDLRSSDGLLAAAAATARITSRGGGGAPAGGSPARAVPDSIRVHSHPPTFSGGPRLGSSGGGGRANLGLAHLSSPTPVHVSAAAGAAPKPPNRQRGLLGSLQAAAAMAGSRQQAPRPDGPLEQNTTTWVCDLGSSGDLAGRFTSQASSGSRRSSGSGSVRRASHYAGMRAAPPPPPLAARPMAGAGSASPDDSRSKREEALGGMGGVYAGRPAARPVAMLAASPFAAVQHAAAAAASSAPQ